MPSSAYVLLLDDNFDLENLYNRRRRSYGAVMCLFWLAPSTKVSMSKRMGAPCYGLSDIINSDVSFDKCAYDLTEKVINDGPYYGDLPWRILLTEQLYEEFHTVYLVIKAVQFIEQQRRVWSVSRVVIEAVLDKDTESFLIRVISDYSGLVINSTNTSRESNGASIKGFASLFDRCRRRVSEALLTGDWRSQIIDLLEWSDKRYRWRTYWGRRISQPSMVKGGVTFFSSYSNNSCNLAYFVNLMPWPVNWLLINDSARRGMPDNHQSYSWIWQHSRAKAYTRTLLEENNLFKKTESESTFLLLQEWLARSRTWRNWRAIVIPLVSALTECWETYLDQAQPRLVVMANQWSIEGWFTQIARRRSIPVLQVMHGVLGGYLYTQTQIISDALVVYGDFWRNLWPEDQRHKILVYNRLGYIERIAKRPPDARKRLTFFSWPLASTPFYNFSEFTDGFIHIFHKLLMRGNYEITVRCHPLENPADFTKRWQRLYGAIPSTMRLSKNEPLGQILAETDVALMFFSTVMLNCFANAIPVVMPGWIDFGWNEALQGVPGVYLAHDFLDLEERLTRWLEEPPELDKRIGRNFVKTPGDGQSDFCALIEDLTS